MKTSETLHFFNNNELLHIAICASINLASILEQTLHLHESIDRKTIFRSLRELAHSTDKVHEDCTVESLKYDDEKAKHVFAISISYASIDVDMECAVASGDECEYTIWLDIKANNVVQSEKDMHKELQRTDFLHSFRLNNGIVGYCSFHVNAATELITLHMQETTEELRVVSLDALYADVVVLH